jgi:hypothetical protein
MHCVLHGLLHGRLQRRARVKGKKCIEEERILRRKIVCLDEREKERLNEREKERCD